jgi:asparagine synthase (glutamine-hydrolysing)
MLYAGTVSLVRAQPLTAREVEALSRLPLSRAHDDTPKLAAGRFAAVVWSDPELLPGRSAIEHGRQVTLVAGYPLLGKDATLSNRAADLARLHDALDGGDAAMLTAARGTFCAAHVDLDAGTLRLAVGPLGVRPVYFCRRGSRVVFANALRLFRDGLVRPLANDALGVAQIASLCFTVGARTPYEGVEAVCGGQSIRFGPTGRMLETYFSWATPARFQSDDGAWLDALTCQFRRAVRARLADPSHAVSLLSGGLDSRLIAAVLTEVVDEVHTIDYGPEGSADLVLGRRIAEALGSRHHEYPQGSTDFWARMATSITDWGATAIRGDGHSWTTSAFDGHGGEAVMAPARMDQAQLDHARAGRLDRALDLLLSAEGYGNTLRALRPQINRLIKSVPACLLQGLAAINHADPARRLQFAMLTHETRGELAVHFEHIDVRRFELLLPFLDADFVRTSAAGPLERLLLHRLYHRWVRQLRPAVASVAWQTYPGHEPCWGPAATGLRNQWRHGWLTDAELARHRRQLGRDVSALLRGDFPQHVLERSIVRAAVWLCRLGFHQYDYILELTRRLAPIALPPSDGPGQAPL